MRSRVLVVAPHPDDELLGCGGTLLRRRAEGAELAWVIVAGMSEERGWPRERIHRRDAEIGRVAELVGFSRVDNLRLPTTELERVSRNELVAQLSAVLTAFEPEEVFVPHPADAHSDHRVVFEAAAACTKWFRYPFVRRLLAYETLSETDASVAADSAFRANYFVDIGPFLERKLEALAVYESEMSAFPFPRSAEAIRALAAVRGASSGFLAAEAFQLLRARE